MSSQQDEVRVVGGGDRVTAHMFTSGEQAAIHAALSLAKQLNDAALLDPAKAPVAKRLAVHIDGALAHVGPSATIISIQEKEPDHGTAH